jgi:hypothetical protein
MNSGGQDMIKVEVPIERTKVPKGHREAREQIADTHAEMYKAKEAGKPFTLLGRTVVGWVASLIWALRKDPPVPEWVRCPSCGAYSSPGTKFCSTCGAPIST